MKEHVLGIMILNESPAFVFIELVENFVFMIPESLGVVRFEY
jgi:hypothetical protein